MSSSVAITTKNKMGHTYTESGKRVTITRLGLKNAKVLNTDNNQITIGYQTSKHIAKPQKVELFKLGVDSVLNRRVSVKNVESEIGHQIGFEGFNPGDLISVQGITKGKGFAGVVKRWGFAGGPKTHGQSDRERAPGAISSGQTLGRVRKGQKMGGRMGGKTKTIKNLVVMGVDKNANEILVSGSVPGPIKGILLIKKIGESKKFDPIANYQVEIEATTDIENTIENENVNLESNNNNE